MAERGKPAVVCWDLDLTVGNFSGMYSLARETRSPITLRYGIRELLSEFSERAGYRNVITSETSIGFITQALNRTNLQNSYSGLFDSETVRPTQFGKHYTPVGRSLSYSSEEMQARMIAIGDDKRDKPVDIGGMVFIELGTPSDPVEALVIREILTTILDEGEGNFKKGYEKLYNKAEEVPNSFQPTRRHLAIGNDISFQMEYRTADEVHAPNERRVPVICNIMSTTHSKPFQTYF